MHITTTHLLLRNFAEDDFEAVREFDTDPEVQRYRGGRVATEEETRAFQGERGLVWEART